MNRIDHVSLFLHPIGKPLTHADLTAAANPFVRDSIVQHRIWYALVCYETGSFRAYPGEKIPAAVWKFLTSGNPVLAYAGDAYMHAHNGHLYPWAPVHPDIDRDLLAQSGLACTPDTTAYVEVYTVA